jgi:hypothetical protein
VGGAVACFRRPGRQKATPRICPWHPSHIFYHPCIKISISSFYGHPPVIRGQAEWSSERSHVLFPPIDLSMDCTSSRVTTLKFHI